MYARAEINQSSAPLSDGGGGGGGHPAPQQHPGIRDAHRPGHRLRQNLGQRRALILLPFGFWNGIAIRGFSRSSKRALKWILWRSFPRRERRGRRGFIFLPRRSGHLITEHQVHPQTEPKKLTHVYVYSPRFFERSAFIQPQPSLRAYLSVIAVAGFQKAINI